MEDAGMTVDGAVKALQAKGACLESDWDFDISKVNDKPPEACFKQAMRYKTRDALKVQLDLEAMKTCLADGFPIILGLKLTARFMDPGKSGFVPTPNVADKASEEHGAHALLAVGYDDVERVFILRNSWGDWWGHGGYCYASYDYVASPDFNLEMYVGMYAIRGLDDYNFTPEEAEDKALFDEAEVNSYQACDIALEEKTTQVSEDTAGKSMGDMFEPNAEALRVFAEIDTDGSGFLDAKELKRAYRLQGVFITDHQLADIIAQYDTNGDGKIGFREYCAMVGVD